MSETETAITQEKTKAQEALARVRKFASLMIKHPLLDDETIAHRVAGKERLAEKLVEYGVSESDFCTILTGSSIWKTDKYSDHDYSVYVRNLAVRDDVAGFHGIPQAEQSGHIISTLDLQGLEVNMMSRVALMALSVVVFTPDELVGGSKEMVAAVRRKIVEQLEGTMPFERQRKWETISEGFNRYFRTWFDEEENSERGLVMPKNKGRTRRERFMNNLYKRSFDTHMGIAKYEWAFEKALNDFEPPSFETYAAAMRESGGVLTTVPVRVDRIVDVKTMPFGGKMKVTNSN